jgi:prepilin-type N-terminal cleavage/methylation domain-containing protein
MLLRHISRAFTLIELLIVVAIIAILAAIAVPNFLEAQTRAKISRAKSDHRTIATGLEAYVVDHNAYSKSNLHSWALSFGSTANNMLPTLERLTTPVSYLTGGVFKDPFTGIAQYRELNLETVQVITDVTTALNIADPSGPKQVYRYISRGPVDTTIWNQPGDMQKALWWLLESCGPDRHYHRMGDALNRVDSPARRIVLTKALYDATNGTVSRGSIWRGGGGSGRGSYFLEMVAMQNK